MKLIWPLQNQSFCDKKYLVWIMGSLMLHGFGMNKQSYESWAAQTLLPPAVLSNVPRLACLAARCMGTKLLEGDNLNLITPSDLTCVKEVMLRELIKPHIFPVTIVESENKESVHHNGVCGLDAIVSTNEIASGACDGKLVFCNKNSLAAGVAYITDISISALSVFEEGGIKIFLGSDGGMIYSIDYPTKKIDLGYRAHENTINRLCVGNSLIASCSNDKTVKIWEKMTGKCLSIFNNFEQAIRGIEWMEDEKILISGSSEGKIKIWNIASKELVKEFQYSDRPRIWGLGTMKKKKHIVAGFNTGNVSVIDGITLQEIAQWYGHGRTISGLSCDNDEKYFATASWDCNTRLWDVRMRACAATFVGHTDWVQKVKCTGNEVVTGARDNMLRLWDIRKLKALDSIPLVSIARWASELKNAPLLKGPSERNELLEEVTKRP